MPIEFAQPQSGPGAEQAAYGYGQLQTILATQPTQKDVFAAQQQAQRQQYAAQVQQQQADQQFQQQQTLQQQRADIQTQLAQAQLSQGETLRMQRLQNATDYVDNDPSLADEEKEQLKLQIRTGLDPLKQRQQKAQTLASELQLQQVQQQQALSEAMGIEGDSARSQSWMRRNSFVDPTTNIRYGQDQHGNLHGQFDPDTGAYVPFDLMRQREANSQHSRDQEDRQRQHDEELEDKQRIARQTQLGTSLDHAEGAVRGEVQHYRDRLPTNPNQQLPDFIQRELNRRGGDAKIDDLSAEDMNQLVGSEAQSRVQRTHGHLFQSQGQAATSQETPRPFRAGDPDSQAPEQKRAVSTFVLMRQRLAAARTLPDGTAMTPDDRRTHVQEIDALQRQLEQYGTPAAMPPAERRSYEQKANEYFRMWGQ
jgi:hypothetical protein